MKAMETSTIFLGAFLLFLVQPLIGNTLLPHFGGTATVWSVCLATFQILLIAGYWYAHLIGQRTHRRASLSVHCALLFTAAGLMWIVAAHRAAIFNSVARMPSALGVFAAIVLLVAAPYIILSANSTLVQEISGGRYGLYAVSNLGSLAGLWAYPFAFERFFGLTHQWTAFAGLCVVYAVLFSILAFTHERHPLATPATTAHERGVSLWRYFVLSAASCFLLNAVSTHLGSDTTPLPLLWVALLSVYLLSYILGFTDRISKVAPACGIVLIPLAFYASWHAGLAEFKYFKAELAIGCLVLFMGGLLVHSRLYKERPNPQHLSMYYLMIALGGAAGGAICSFLMPVVSDRVIEYPIAIAMIAGLAVFESVETFAKIGLLPTAPKTLFWCAMAAVATAGLLGVARIGSADGTVLKRYRNFYGTGIVANRTIKVSVGHPYEANEFRCNGTTHGLQITSGAWAGTTPPVYSAAHAGGLPLLTHPKEKAGAPMRVGLCGMGIGTLASYARQGDFYRFYEINPDVAAIAKDKSLFTFLSDCKGTVEVVVDDARRALERERTDDEAKYDVLVVDVFNGDAIPPHMATKEAFRLYLDRLSEDGILAFHLSNWHLDLMPMMKVAAKEFSLQVEAFYCASTQCAFESTWAFLSRGKLPEMFDARCHTKVEFDLVPDVEMMTDERHSLLPYIQWRID